MKFNRFFKDTLVLTMSNLTTGVLGFIFSIIISRELGPVGMGLYGLVMPLYNLFICLVCGGIITAISKISAEYLGKDDTESLFGTIRSTLIFNLVIGLSVIIPLYFLTPSIGTYIIKDTATIAALKFTCPAILFVALSNTLKGYFYGTSNMKIPAFIDICEKALRIGMIILLINIFHDKNVTIAYATLCIGELLSLILLYTYYKFHKSKYEGYKFEPRISLLKNVLTISIPLCFTAIFSTILSTASSLIIPRRLLSAGMSYSDAIALIGKFSGMAVTIVIFPMIIINSICTVVIPDLSQSLIKEHYFSARRRIDQVFKISLLVGVATLTIGTIIPDELGNLFYNRNDLGTYILFTSMVVPIFFFSNTTYGILNGLGRQKIILRNAFFMSILEISMLYIFTGIPSINIYGFGLELIITSTATAIINCIEIKKYINFKFDYFNFTFILLLSAVIILISCILRPVNLIYKIIFILSILSILAVCTKSFIKTRKFI